MQKPAKAALEKRAGLRPGGLPMDTDGLRQSLANRLNHSLGKDAVSANERDWYNALALALRDRLMTRWLKTQQAYAAADSKRVYYLSLEYLIGRSLMNAAINLHVDEEVAGVLDELGLELEQIREVEPDAGLGNGGLGRLAACFLDSMATLSLPGFGYGIRYNYGIFTQMFARSGEQVERPTTWLRYQHMWELPREDRIYTVHFGGRVLAHVRDDGERHHEWVDTDPVLAVAYDTPVPGNNAKTVNHLRLWSAQSSGEFDLQLFNAGKHGLAAAKLNEAENLSHVLYPDDRTAEGRELRLRQQYFFVCASLQDIIRNYLSRHDSLDQLPDKVAIQLNDTHPALAIPELMRICRDEYGYSWNQAWDITRRVFSYTNHTLLPEALETWPVELFERLLPRHLGIIYKINRQFLDEVAERYPSDLDRMRRMSLISEDGERRVRMTNLAIVGSHKVNGVAAMHSRLMQETIFKDFHEFYPGKFINVTNGVTPRRWIKAANPGLAALLVSRLGQGWEDHLDSLAKLRDMSDDPEFRSAFARIKRRNKQRLADRIARDMGIHVSPDSMFDVQAKRIHEYKRQLLNLLYVITRYRRILADPGADHVPRTVIISGKAAPGYVMAKTIVKLINNVASVINADPVSRDALKLVMIPNYSVSVAEMLLPAADLSQQISTAGMEASGTGNMKLAMNGALTIGTLDGANVEIRDEVGEDNIFIFGLTAEEVAERRASGYFPRDIVRSNAELAEVLDMIAEGSFSPDSSHEYTALVEHLMSDGEHFLVLADYEAYLSAQDEVDALYRDQDAWLRKAIINVSGSGKFSSDRSIQDYADNIWSIEPVVPFA